MKYSISYYKDFRYYDEIDEVIFPYSYKLLEWFEKNPKFYNKRAVFDITKENSIIDILPVLLKFKEKFAEVAVVTPIYTSFMNTLKENGIPYFFNRYCKTYDEVYSFVELGASDIYVVETLGFNIKNIGTYCHEKEVKVRVMPNVAQTTMGEDSALPAECRFFIRPQDVYAYEPYVDMFELWGDPAKLSVTFEIYKAEEWKGDLYFLIEGLPYSVNINTPVPFADARLKCMQNCYNCNLCTRYKEFHDELNKTELTINKREKNEE